MNVSAENVLPKPTRGRPQRAGDDPFADRNGSLLKPLPSGNRVGEDLFISEFKDAAGRDAPRQAGDVHGQIFQEVRNMQGRPVSFDGRIGGHQELLELAVPDPIDERIEGELIGSNAFQRRDSSQ
jgi:hypothetical protein